MRVVPHPSRHGAALGAVQAACGPTAKHSMSPSSIWSTTRLFAPFALSGVFAALCCSAFAAEQRFDITGFRVEGNTLVTSATIDTALRPLTGPDRAFDDIQRAVQAVEQAYRDAGFTAVTVSVPEQELSDGTVRLRVAEVVIGSVTIVGNRHFSDDNVRASLGRLQPGRAPELQALSESVQLANDNPAKQVSVSLAEGAVAGTVDAKVAVTDHDPLRWLATLDNTGTSASGQWRTGVAVQHANLFGRDQVGTLAYTTTPDGPSGMHLNVYSLGYRVPLYDLGDSMDLIYGRSSVNSPATSPTLGGVLGFTGRGDSWGLRYNHGLGRSGESTSRLVVGLDRRHIDSRCNIDGDEIAVDGPTPPISSCVPYTTTPLGLTWLGQTDGVDRSLAYNLGVSRNLASGPRFTNVDGRSDRYSYLTTGNRATRDGFVVLRGGASLLQGLAGGWQLRLAGNAQVTDTPLVSSEQIGLVGANAVRGFDERAVVADSGVVLNAEVYTPELGGVAGVPGNLRALAFADAGHGENHAANGAVPAHAGVSSFGLGARYGLGRDASLRLDIARVVNAGGSYTEQRGDWRAHVSALVAF
jgi:hemolysin activation/secretion protein